MSDILNKNIVPVLNRNRQAINILTPTDAFCQMGGLLSRQLGFAALALGQHLPDFQSLKMERQLINNDENEWHHPDFPSTRTRSATLVRAARRTAQLAQGPRGFRAREL